MHTLKPSGEYDIVSKKKVINETHFRPMLAVLEVWPIGVYNNVSKKKAAINCEEHNLQKRFLLPLQ